MSHSHRPRRSATVSVALPGVASTEIVSLPLSGAVASKATMRVPALGESHSCRGVAVSTTFQPQASGETIRSVSRASRWQSQ